MNKADSNPHAAESTTRFVVLHHQFPTGHVRNDHWDLMLEWKGELITWALDELPKPGKSMIAIQLPGHRIHYLDYEGQVSGGRGSVKRVLSGKYEWIRTAGTRTAVLLVDSEGGVEERWKIEFLSDGSELRIEISNLPCS